MSEIIRPKFCCGVEPSIEKDTLGRLDGSSPSAIIICHVCKRKVKRCSSTNLAILAWNGDLGVEEYLE